MCRMLVSLVTVMVKVVREFLTAWLIDFLSIIDTPNMALAYRGLGSLVSTTFAKNEGLLFLLCFNVIAKLDLGS